MQNYILLFHSWFVLSGTFLFTFEETSLIHPQNFHYDIHRVSLLVSVTQLFVLKGTESSSIQAVPFAYSVKLVDLTLSTIEY